MFPAACDRKFMIFTWGCQMNEDDSEQIANLLMQMGNSPTGREEEADIAVLVTCSVRAKPEEKAKSMLGRLRILKEARPGMIIAVCGCMAQREGEALRRGRPYIDLVIGTANIPRIPEMIRELDEKRRFASALELPRGEQDSLTLPERVSRPEKALKSFVPVMYGCDNFCAYCIVPYVRGRERSRPLEDVVEEVRELAGSGRREVTLLGQNVNSYGATLEKVRAAASAVSQSEATDLPPSPLPRREGEPCSPPRFGEGSGERWLPSPVCERIGRDVLPSPVRGGVGGEVAPLPGSGRGWGRGGSNTTQSPDFADLLRAVNNVEGIERIRFTTSHPKDLSDRLIEAMRDLDKVCEHIHLAAQSGDDEVLGRMNRKYTAERFRERVAAMRSAVPEIAITTDILVGFPGETDEQFANTLRLVEEVRFDGAFMFAFNPIPNTAAASLDGHLPAKVKNARLRRLIELQNRITCEINDSRVGQVFEVLVEGISPRNPNRLTGLTRQNKTMNFPGEASLIGKLVNARAVEGHLYGFVGELIC